MIEIPSQRLDSALKIAALFRDARSMAISTHVNGDGDGWGSACALAYHFRPLGVQVHLLAASPFPDRFRFILPSGGDPLDPGLEGMEALRSADVQIVVDASESSRLGQFASEFEAERTVVIDHHAVALDSIKASLSLIDPSASATTELVHHVLTCTGDVVGPGPALALYVGLVTDTGSFRYSNTTPRTHRLAAELIEAGIDPEAVYRPLFATLTPAELATLQAALAAHQRDEEHGITWSVLDKELIARIGGLAEYEGILDHLRNLQGTEVAILFRDLGGSVKISLRSSGVTDVASVARALGGGGHEKAAGAEVEGDLAEVTGRVLEACRAAISEGMSRRS